MLFNSPEYIFLFLPVATLCYFGSIRIFNQQVGNFFLLALSILFYSYTSYNYLPLITFSIVTNYFLGKKLQKLHSNSNREQKFNKLKIILWSGVAFNIILLGYFKYSNFFIEVINLTSGASYSLLQLALPLAISFYTFQQISYLVDCYHAKIDKSIFTDYCFFVLFFPKLIAGPIARYHEIIPQFTRKTRDLLDWQNVATGLFVFSAGLFKKVILADSFASMAAGGQPAGIVAAWLASLCYTFQIYFDFSGYSDMAIGSALLFNIRLPVNFNSPYLATSIQDFWRRWHMTLSRWLRDYLYIPLGGNRKGKHLTLVNIFITFFLGGIWHGAGWTFVIWGILHGIGLAVHRVWQETGLKMPAFLGWLCTFLYLNLTWVFFSAPGIHQAMNRLKTMAGLEPNAPFGDEFSTILQQLAAWNTAGNLTLHAAVFLFSAAAVLLSPNTMQLINFLPYKGAFAFKTDIKYALLLSIMFFLSMMSFFGITEQGQFIYSSF